MPDVDVPVPFEAYLGEQPYIFVGYAHRDAALVFPDLTRLRDHGYRIWYDEGIDPGNEWPDEVASALNRASIFLVFISPSAVKPRNVRNEINFALDNQKPVIAVHLLETQLPLGLQLRMGGIQAVMKYRMSNGSYLRKLKKALPAKLRSTDLPRPTGKELNSPDPEKRLLALSHIALRREGSFFDQLVELLRTDRDSRVRERAALALDHLGDMRAKPFLIEALSDHEWGVRSNAGWALVHFGKVVAGDVQQIAQQSSDPVAREMAQLVLERL